MADGSAPEAQVSSRRLLNATAVMASGTAISRVLGFVKAMLLVFVFVAGIQMSLYYVGHGTAHQIAVAAYNEGRLYGADASIAQSHAEALLATSGLGSGTVSVSGTADEITITVTGEVATIVPGIPTQVTTTVTGPIEQWSGR